MAFFIDATQVVDTNGIATASALGSLTNIVQIQTYTTSNYLSGSIGGSSNPAYNSGSSLYTFTFTPTSASSTLWLYSGNVNIQEYANANDVFYLAAYYDTTRIQVVNAPSIYSLYAYNYNATFCSLNKTFSSWGTSQKTIDIRVGAGNGNGGSVNVNYDNYTSRNGSVVFTMVEFK